MAKVYRAERRDFNKFITLKKIVEEINSYKNIIYFYGTIRVMEYADSGTLNVLHNEGIVHRDLHSNIMMLSHQNIKLANLGSSRRIVETPNPCPHGYFPNKYAILMVSRDTVPNTPEDYVKIYTDSTNSCYTVKDNIDERRYLANDSIPELQPGRNVNGNSIKCS
ncbi:uncharacterized protein OCT59_026739 [Rhizophagus irregularis]|uniref:uncharacterized protein n=1 Tax=Rhizophagus irregularis TaxID=588596 RepID=UPI000CC3FD95|nr:hypothetical protein OCT59_026739 [Rhizophagus irregularis]